MSDVSLFLLTRDSRTLIRELVWGDSTTRVVGRMLQEEPILSTLVKPFALWRQRQH